MTSLAPYNSFRDIIRAERKQPVGIDLMYLRAARLWSMSFGSSKHARRLAERVVAHEQACRALSENELDFELAAARGQCRGAEHAEQHYLYAIALVREAARRELGLEAFEVQIRGALAMLDGVIAEMATGEGKTLSIAIAGVMSAWRSTGCHVMTANDYLAQRDAEWVRPLCARCAVTVGCITSQSTDPGRKSVYRADILYATPREIASDYLRDALERQTQSTRVSTLLSAATGSRDAISRPRLRHTDVAIIDEADAVLIDEAVTPLIMSNRSMGESYTADIFAAERLARGMTHPRDYIPERSQRAAYLTETGRQAVREAFQTTVQAEAVAMRRYEELLVVAIVARHHYLEDRDYVIQDGQAVIIDQATGRLMPDRSFRAGLHQAIEAKHALTPRPIQESVASISFQRFFAKYKTLSGASGTAIGVSAELWEIYTRTVQRIPSNKPLVRTMLPVRRFGSRTEKENAIVRDACALIREGRAVLIGCQSVATSERLAALLRPKDMRCEVLNAVRHAEEARIIEEAGRTERITIATNMAGRGTDIKVDPDVIARGGLHVIVAEPLSSKRLERQLAGRCGRQGDPGSVQAYISPDDELFTLTTPSMAKALPGWMRSRLPRLAQYIAEQVARARRRQVLLDDEKTDELLGFAGPPL
jgi:preprotein translocase subunit SecA